MERIYDTTYIGLHAKKRRKELGMTQSRLANISGVNRRFISELERGKPTIQLDKVIDILNMLGLDLYVSERGV